MNMNEFKLQLIQSDPRALELLEHLKTKGQDAMISFVDCYLQSAELDESAGACVHVLESLSAVIGKEQFEQWVKDRWNSVSVNARLALANGSYSPELISTEIAAFLFYSDNSTTRDRHRIVAGLAATMNERKCQNELLRLIPDIGEYEDQSQQAVLEGFVNAIKRIQ